MKLLVVTTEWPTEELPASGDFVRRQVEALRAAGVDVRVFSFRGRAMPWRYVRAGLQIRRLCHHWRPDVIHAHFGQGGFAAAAERATPLVVTFHGSDLFGIPKTSAATTVKSIFHRFASRIAARRADEIITVSDQLATLVGRRNCRVVPIAIDAMRFRPCPKRLARRELGIPDEAKVVLFIGDPANPIKNFSLAEAAVRSAKGLCPQLTLRVCNGLTPSAIATNMNAADALIVTSLHEGGPLVAREALACGLPVITVPVGDVRQRLSSLPWCHVCAYDAEALGNGIADALLANKETLARIASPRTYDDPTEALIKVYTDAASGFNKRRSERGLTSARTEPQKSI